jgi:hypothetical protein
MARARSADTVTSRRGRRGWVVLGGLLCLLFFPFVSASVAAGADYRKIVINPAANPFQGPPDAAYGGSKHVNFMWHPVKKRIYTFGGDYGVGAGAFGQPAAGANFTTNDPVSPHTYQEIGSLRNDQFSIDPYATGPVSWRLEHPFLPRNLGGTREVRPPRPDQVSLVWDSTRNKIWGFQTAMRSEFLYLFDGVPDPWANGELVNGEGTGTWSFVPGASGSPGAWTLETTAKTWCGYYGATHYTGNVLYTSMCDERIAHWAYDAGTDRFYAFGSNGTNNGIFIFDPNAKTYEWRTLSLPSAYGYYSTTSSQVAIDNGWMYGVVWSRTSTARQSQLVRVNLARALAIANGGAIPDNASYRQEWQFPTGISLSPNNAWELNNDASAGKISEHAGVLAVAGKIVVVVSYDSLTEGTTTKLLVFDPSNATFFQAPPPPAVTECVATRTPCTIAANSWVALPDSGEVLFGLNTGGYTNNVLWAYKVPVGTVPPPAAPANLRAQ